MKEPLGSYSGEQEPAIVVRDGAGVDLPSRGGGLVAINSRGLSTRLLQSAGFPHVRRFAAIPNLRQARWLIPLDSPAVSSAAFSLYTPARRSARLKRWAVRLATHTRLPFWYRDRITIALPRPSPLEQAVCALFPGRDIRFALSSGAPEGARNRKASALVMDARGTLLAFLKLARSPIARQILAREAEVLPKLRHLPVPRLLVNDEVDGTLVLAQTPLAGGPAPVPLGAAHLDFLHSLQSQDKLIASDTAMVAGLSDRLAAWPDLLEVLENTLPALRSFSIPRTVVHGDFAPWNLRLHEGRISAFDWEYAELSGLPLVDQIHYGLQVGMMIENWDIPRARRFLAQLAESAPMDLQPPHVRAIEAVYLLDTLARLLGEGYPAGHEMIIWHRGLLDAGTTRAGASAERVAAA